MDLVGRSVEQEWPVTSADTANAVGSGSLPVLGTPRLLAWLEATTCAVIDPALPEGSTSVGTRVDAVEPNVLSVAKSSSSHPNA